MILSQCAFTFEACGELLMTLRPASAKTTSKAWVNWPPWSRSRNFSLVMSSPVCIRKLRAAWVVHGPVALAVTPSSDGNPVAPARWIDDWAGGVLLHAKHRAMPLPRTTTCSRVTGELDLASILAAAELSRSIGDVANEAERPLK